MTSDKQAEANRRNALKSTGPKTSEGKAVARLNSVKHGLLSQELLLPGEDQAALEELSERLMSELQPEGEMEGLLVERIIAAIWRLRRLRRVEAGIFAWELEDIVGTTLQPALGLSFIRDSNSGNAFSKLSRYETTIERSLYKALHELQRLQAARRTEGSITPPMAVDLDVSGVHGEDS